MVYGDLGKPGLNFYTALVRLVFNRMVIPEFTHLGLNDPVKEWAQGGVAVLSHHGSVTTSTPPALYPGNGCHSDRVPGKLTGTMGRICKIKMLTR
jgi:hypothetical protein